MVVPQNSHIIILVFGGMVLIFFLTRTRLLGAGFPFFHYIWYNSTSLGCIPFFTSFSISLLFIWHYLMLQEYKCYVHYLWLVINAALILSCFFLSFSYDLGGLIFLSNPSFIFLPPTLFTTPKEGNNFENHGFFLSHGSFLCKSTTKHKWRYD